MHFAFVTAASRSLAEAGEPCAVLAGSSDAHASWADRNAGDRVSMPERPKPSGLGSGKFRTPFERMQSANLTAVLETLAAAVLGLLADPQAPITSALATTATAIASSRRWGALLDSALCMSDSLAGPSAQLYRPVDNTAVTPLRRRYPNRAASSRHAAGLARSVALGSE